MKYLLIGAICFVCMSAAVITTNIVQPAQPKQQQHGYFDNAKDADAFIGNCIKQGYIIKIVCCTQSQGDNFTTRDKTIMVVAEKY